MMLQFVPQTDSPFQFQAQLDGTVFNFVVTWNVYGERYYVNIYTLAGVRVYTCAIVGSVADYPVVLLPPKNPVTGVPWASQFYFVGATSTFVVTP